MKRRLRQLLALTIVFSMTPAAAFADEAASGPLVIKKSGAAVQAEEEKEESEEYSVIARTYPYFRQFWDGEDPEESEMTLYFVNGGDIPYVALSEYADFLSGLYRDLDLGDITYDFSQTGDQTFTLSRPDNGSVMYVDTSYDTITFKDLNTFKKKPGVNTLVSLLELPDPDMSTELDFSDIGMEEFLDLLSGLSEEMDGMDENEAAEYISDLLSGGDLLNEDGELLVFASAAASVNRHGAEVNIDLGEYLIDAVSMDGECYMPMQTMNDILVSTTYMQYVFNGRAVYGFPAGCSLFEKTYEAAPEEMSEEFAKFNYNELRLLLDYFYGLAPEHSINDFGTMLTDSTGLAEDLASTDPRKADSALSKLTGTYLDDLHSGFNEASWRTGKDDDAAVYSRIADLGPSTLSMIESTYRFEDARKAVYRAWVPGYEEVGDTAFVTFDEFNNVHGDYAEFYELGNPDNPKDTFELISYANREIRREGSPVKNIVIDLSNNGPVCDRLVSGTGQCCASGYPDRRPDSRVLQCGH